MTAQGTKTLRGLLAVLCTLAIVTLATLPAPSAAMPIAPHDVAPYQTHMHLTAFGRPDLRDLPLGLRPVPERAVFPPSLTLFTLLAAAVAVAYGAGRYRTSAPASPRGHLDTSHLGKADHLPALGQSLDRQSELLGKLSKATRGTLAGEADRHLAELRAEQHLVGHILENALDAAWGQTQSARASCNLSDVLRDLALVTFDNKGGGTDSNPEIGVPAEVLRAAFALLRDETPSTGAPLPQIRSVNIVEDQGGVGPTVRVSIASDVSDDRMRICSDLLTPWKAHLQRGSDPTHRVTLYLPYAAAQVAEASFPEVGQRSRLQGDVA